MKLKGESMMFKNKAKKSKKDRYELSATCVKDRNERFSQFLIEQQSKKQDMKKPPQIKM